MTRAQTASYGFVIPPPLHHWMHAVLLLFAILVQGVRATFGMSLRHRHDDWHIAPVTEALPRTKPGIQLRDSTITTKSFPSSTRESFFVATQGLADIPRVPRPEHILRDDRCVIPQEESRGRHVHASTPTTLMLTFWRAAPKVSKYVRRLTRLAAHRA